MQNCLSANPGGVAPQTSLATAREDLTYYTEKKKEPEADLAQHTDLTTIMLEHKRVLDEGTVVVQRTGQQLPELAPAQQASARRLQAAESFGKAVRQEYAAVLLKIDALTLQLE